MGIYFGIIMYKLSFMVINIHKGWYKFDDAPSNWSQGCWREREREIKLISDIVMLDLYRKNIATSLVFYKSYYVLSL